MKCRTIAYGRTINLGNYENFRLEMTVELEDADVTADCLEVLTKSVDSKCESIKAKKTNATHK